MRVRLVAGAYALLASLSMGAAIAFRDGHPLVHPRPWLQLDEVMSIASSVALGLAFAFVVTASARVFVSRFAWAERLHGELRPVARGLTTAQILLLASLSSLGEELFFRSLLTVWLGVIASGVLFGLSHQLRGPSRWWWVAWAAIVGIGLGAIFSATGSLVGPLLAHAIVNAVNFAFLRDRPVARRRRPLGGIFRPT